MKEYRLEK